MNAGTLSFFEKDPPLAVLIVGNLRNVTFQTVLTKKPQSATLALPSGDILRNGVMLKYVGSIGEGEYLSQLSDPLLEARLEQWMQYETFFTPEYDLKELCSRLNAHLALRTFLVGSVMTVADLNLWVQLKNLRREWAELQHVRRWFTSIEKLPQVRSAIEKWSSKGKTANNHTKSNPQESSSYKIDLPNAVMGKVVTRFPPEPSGFLHVGHAKAALLNFHIAKMYKGKLIIRFDDTNPVKEKDEFVENILKDLNDLGIVGDRLTYTSDYFDQLIQLATQLIQSGVVYADNTPIEVMRQERMDGIESKCRNRGVEENLQAWEKMKIFDPEATAFCLRIKLDMTATNKALRDPVIYRCNDRSHWRTGNKYKVYPTYDFACPFVDSFEGVTHAMRSSEYKDREAQYKWILKEMQKVEPSLPSVEIIEFARLNLVYTVLSKRKLQWFVDTGRVEGWNDPRFPTVQGIIRRGLTLEAMKEYILSQGASKNITFQEWDKIWTINKKVIDPVVPRHTAIETQNRIQLNLDGPSDPELVTVPRHKKHAPAGTKIVVRSSHIWIEKTDADLVSAGEEITLMDWGNCIIQTKTENQMEGRLHLEGDFKKTKWKWTWLPVEDELVPLSLVYFDYLITKKRLDEDDNFEDFVNPETKKVVEAMGDRNMRVLNKGDILQLERKGYFIVDRPFWKPSMPMVLFNIPDGRLKK